jgi:hypothetical protein
MGALLLAFGITGDWDKIGMIDTEEGSGELYVGVQKHGIEIGEFQYIRISKDFSPVHYVDAVKAFEASGVEVIIIDSLTHAWAGTEGLLDKQGKVAAKSGNSYTAWRDVTPQHNALVNSMLQSKCHIIATMRSKVEYALQDGDNGKKKVVKMGMAPIQREGMEYEFTAFFEVDSNSIASPSKDRTDLFSTLNAAGQLDKRSFVITPKVGEELLGWLNKGGEPEPTTLEKIQTLLAKVTLDPENPQDAFLQNADLIVQPDDKLNKILTYLTEKTNG